MESAVHADETSVSTIGQVEMEQFIANIHKHFAIKDLGEAIYYEGYHTECNEEGHILERNQHIDVKAIAGRHGTMRTSMIRAGAGRFVLPKANGLQTKAEMEEVRGIPHWEAVEGLIWA